MEIKMKTEFEFPLEMNSQNRIALLDALIGNMNTNELRKWASKTPYSVNVSDALREAK